MTQAHKEDLAHQDREVNRELVDQDRRVHQAEKAPEEYKVNEDLQASKVFKETKALEVNMDPLVRKVHMARQDRLVHKEHKATQGRQEYKAPEDSKVLRALAVREVGKVRWDQEDRWEREENEGHLE